MRKKLRIFLVVIISILGFAAGVFLKNTIVNASSPECSTPDACPTGTCPIPIGGANVVYDEVWRAFTGVITTQHGVGKVFFGEEAMGDEIVVVQGLSSCSAPWTVYCATPPCPSGSCSAFLKDVISGSTQKIAGVGTGHTMVAVKNMADNSTDVISAINTQEKDIVEQFPKLKVTRWRIEGHIHFP